MPDVDIARLPALPLADFDFSKWFPTGQVFLSWPLPQPKAGSELKSFDVPREFVEPLLWVFRQSNTLADALFYDVGLLWLRLLTRGITVTTANSQFAASAQDSVAAAQAAAKFINLSAHANPEGAILVVDAHHAPFVQSYDDVKSFLRDGLSFTPSRGGEAKPVRMISVTGVGSSALGSAAFAWNISESLREPVAAIVPGYGLADIIPQALGGWFGFGVHDFMRRLSQQVLARTALQLAKVGRRLSSTAIGDEAFQSGNPESEILHEILANAKQIKRLYGHSKGALCIQNAVRSLTTEHTRQLHITTFGCVIQEETDADYNQVMGDIDGLGQLNSWGNWPEHWIKSWHSTNSLLPLTMPVADLVKKDLRAEDPVRISRAELEAAFAAALAKLQPRPQEVGHA
ncbi:hypothetical protein [Bradyrhizobium sp. BR 10261]|uniref:hypothetical protein n=1 Tax=Bradyrhizobium sp. BR 10261 TaxID=2749992 RepID=UPI001C64C1C7|nr:hypothetical protein [Bradyrhizobium sp. BR 10261]MBW7962465.1 hypothetical protein [Bradyrhizobium sp. BR 10261]